LESMVACVAFLLVILSSMNGVRKVVGGVDKMKIMRSSTLLYDS
jgi:hypothetical protein